MIVESAKGKIIGGIIEAEQKVEAAYIGNESEKRTQIIVKGFSRSKMKQELDDLQKALVKAKTDLAKTKQAFAVYPDPIDSASKQYMGFESARDRYFNCKDEVRRLENQLRTLQKYFRVKGEGEVNILKKAYPNTMIRIKNETKELLRDSIASCFFMQDNELKEI